MTHDDRETIAEFEIFSGKFDHWGEIDTETGRFECGADASCALRGLGFALPEGAFRRHLLQCHLDQVVEALEQRP